MKKHGLKKHGLKVATLAASLLMMVGGQAAAQAAVSGNIGYTSNYLWRGVSQTSKEAAVQGGIDYENPNGFYAGTWASTIDFGGQESYELDIYAGYAGEYKDFSYDIGYLYYGYPDALGSVDFGEIYGSVGWKNFSIGLAQFIHAGDDVAGGSYDEEDYMYATFGASFPLSKKLTLDFHYGYSHGDVIDAWYSDEDGSSYSDYSVSLSVATDLGDVGFALSNTSLEGDEAKVVLSYNYGFDML